jgi:hypothetical protein
LRSGGERKPLYWATIPLGFYEELGDPWPSNGEGIARLNSCQGYKLFKFKVLNMPFFSLIQDFVLRNDFY